MVGFKTFTKEHLIRFVKWGYDPSGDCFYNPHKILHAYDESQIEFKDFIPEVKKFFKNNTRSLTFFLSGGLDSSFLFSLFVDSGAHLKTDYEILSIKNGPDQAFVNDLMIHLGLRKEIKWLKHPKFSDDMLKCAMQLQGSPMDLGSMQANFLLFTNADKEIIITGDGSDEIFGGYTRHQYYDTSALDKTEELFYYHIPRVVNMAKNTNKELYTPYMYLVKQDLFCPGKERLREIAKDYLPTSIIERKKLPLKSEDAMTGIPYRAKLVRMWENECR